MSRSSASVTLSRCIPSRPPKVMVTKLFGPTNSLRGLPRGVHVVTKRRVRRDGYSPAVTVQLVALVADGVVVQERAVLVYDVVGDDEYGILDGDVLLGHGRYPFLVDTMMDGEIAGFPIAAMRRC